MPYYFVHWHKSVTCADKDIMKYSKFNIKITNYILPIPECLFIVISQKVINTWKIPQTLTVVSYFLQVCFEHQQFHYIYHWTY